MTGLDRRRGVFVTKEDCSLCDEAARLIHRYAPRFGITVDFVDIADNPDLEAEFRERIPVLLAVGRKVLAEGPMTAFTVQRALLRIRLGL